MSRNRKRDLTLFDYNNMVEFYHNESDRAAAVLAGSFAEHYTGIFLSEFARNDRVVDQLFFSGPLSSFSARINLAYAFNLIDTCLFKDLLLIKDIRNFFAHEPLHTSFHASSVRGKCSNLSTRETSPEPRDQFLMAVGLAVGKMHNILLEREQIVK